ncbi:hypothetical protein [Novosphingobium album (ex Hu et al. 2023)]|uniref:Uncharacterized protein n=1 Tax=Novosphingobium album (ex Hu et al. 2023) TaxID=2930093 RepID=A0ABT0B6Y9_9SPHN|nr:hypothetical protein [Novosphingobium album (ex Hu et al. 2023)]MCJ2180847.1 hypothetical protein [Novosphingobium album (ex Hu et al. 2023)]
MTGPAADLAGGLDAALEYFQPERPADPEMRDSATLWVMDKSGRFALPRVTIDVVGGEWETPRLQLNFAAEGGKVMRVWSQGPGGLALDGDGRAMTRDAGALRFACLEPFRRWALEFDGTAMRTTTQAELEASQDAVPAALAFRLEAEMAAPPWLMGGLTPEAASRMLGGDASALMGGVRYEQLCRIRGTISYDGADHDVDATGMRVRRQGVRNMSSAMGHCQHSALFPSGRAFGAIVMARGPEGPETFNEAFLLQGDGRKVAARVARAPWMTRLGPGGEDVGLVLESEVGTIRIEGQALLSMFDHYNFEMAGTSVLHQGTARYVWDGEEAIGLIERCTLRSRLNGL